MKSTKAKHKEYYKSYIRLFNSFRIDIIRNIILSNNYDYLPATQVEWKLHRIGDTVYLEYMLYSATIGYITRECVILQVLWRVVDATNTWKNVDKVGKF